MARLCTAGPWYRRSTSPERACPCCGVRATRWVLGARIGFLPPQACRVWWAGWLPMPLPHACTLHSKHLADARCSQPPARLPTPQVAAGSLNRDGVLVLRALRPAEESTPARIARLTLDAQVGGAQGTGCCFFSLLFMPPLLPPRRGCCCACVGWCGQAACSGLCVSALATCMLPAPTTPCRATPTARNCAAPRPPHPPHRPSARSCARGWMSLGSCTARPLWAPPWPCWPRCSPRACRCWARRGRCGGAGRGERGAWGLGPGAAASGARCTASWGPSTC